MLPIAVLTRFLSVRRIRIDTIKDEQFFKTTPIFKLQKARFLRNGQPYFSSKKPLAKMVKPSLDHLMISLREAMNQAIKRTLANSFRSNHTKNNHYNFLSTLRSVKVPKPSEKVIFKEKTNLMKTFLFPTLEVRTKSVEA